jgi:hypothetical protein
VHASALVAVAKGHEHAPLAMTAKGTTLSYAREYSWTWTTPCPQARGRQTTGVSTRSRSLSLRRRQSRCPGPWMQQLARAPICWIILLDIGLLVIELDWTRH